MATPTNDTVSGRLVVLGLTVIGTAATMIGCGGSPGDPDLSSEEVAQPVMSASILATSGIDPSVTHALEEQGLGRISVTERTSLSTGSKSIDPNNSGILLGQGYNSVTGEKLRICVENRNVTTTSGGIGGQLVDYGSQEVLTIDEVRQNLGMSASMSFKKGIFSISAKVDRFYSSRLSSHDLFYLVRVVVENETQVLADWVPTRVARQAARRGLDHFLRTCGNGFVSGRTTGGELNALVRVSLQTKQERDDVARQLKAGGLGLSGELNYARALETLQSQTNTQYTFLRSGSVSDIPTIDALKTYALRFPTQVSNQAGQAWPIRVQVTGYWVFSEADGIPPRFAAALREHEEIMYRLAVLRDSIVLLQGDLENIRANPGRFGNPPRAELDAFQNTLTSAMRTVHESAAGCGSIDQPTRPCSTPPDISLPSLPNETPPPPPPGVAHLEFKGWQAVPFRATPVFTSRGVEFDYVPLGAGQPFRGEMLLVLDPNGAQFAVQVIPHPTRAGYIFQLYSQGLWVLRDPKPTTEFLRIRLPDGTAKRVSLLVAGDGQIRFEYHPLE